MPHLCQLGCKRIWVPDTERDTERERDRDRDRVPDTEHTERQVIDVGFWHGYGYDVGMAMILAWL